MLFLNGEPITQLAPEAITENRAFLFGDGVFETMRVFRKSIPLLKYHLSRLSESLDRLGINSPHPEIVECVESILGHPELPLSCSLRLTVSRGGHLKGYQFEQAKSDIWGIIRPCEVLSSQPHSLSIGISQVKLSNAPRLAGLKHLNRLDQVAVQADLSDQGCAEGVVLSDENYVIEGLSSNIFWAKEGKVYTPSLAKNGVKGVMRAFCVETLKHKGIEVTEVESPLEELLEADEVFMTNAVQGVRSVDAILSNRFFENSLARLLQGAFAKLG